MSPPSAATPTSSGARMAVHVPIPRPSGVADFDFAVVLGQIPVRLGFRYDPATDIWRMDITNANNTDRVEAIRVHARLDLLAPYRASAPWLPPGELVFYPMIPSWAAPDWQTLGDSGTVFAVYWDVGERPDDAPAIPQPARVRLL